MLFAFSISAQFICFFQFEEVIRAVIIEDVFPPFNDFWLFLYSCAWIKSFLPQGQKANGKYHEVQRRAARSVSSPVCWKKVWKMERGSWYRSALTGYHSGHIQTDGGWKYPGRSYPVPTDNKSSAGKDSRS